MLHLVANLTLFFGLIKIQELRLLKVLFFG